MEQFLNRLRSVGLQKLGIGASVAVLLIVVSVMELVSRRRISAPSPDAAKIWAPPPVPASAMPRLAERGLAPQSGLGGAASVESVGVDELVQVLSNGMPPDTDAQGLAEAIVENPELREDWKDFKKRAPNAPKDEPAFLASLLKKSEFKSLAPRFTSSAGTSAAFQSAAPPRPRMLSSQNVGGLKTASTASSRFTVGSALKPGQRSLSSGKRLQGFSAGGATGWSSRAGASGTSFTAENAGFDANIGSGFGQSQGAAARQAGPSNGAPDKLPGAYNGNDSRGGPGGRASEETLSWEGNGASCVAALELSEQKTLGSCLAEKPPPKQPPPNLRTCCSSIATCKTLTACLEKGQGGHDKETEVVGISVWACQGNPKNNEHQYYNSGLCYSRTTKGVICDTGEKFVGKCEFSISADVNGSCDCEAKTSAMPTVLPNGRIAPQAASPTTKTCEPVYECANCRFWDPCQSKYFSFSPCNSAGASAVTAAGAQAGYPPMSALDRQACDRDIQARGGGGFACTSQQVQAGCRAVNGQCVCR